MNFSPLQLRKPALAALGERAENLFRDHHYRECTQVMRQFAEGVLRTILKDDRHTYSEMMRTPLVRQLADSLTFEYFRRIRDLGNEASHFRLGTSGTMLETGERHYRVRTADDAAECLGVNSRIQLAQVTKVMQRRINHEHMAAGVTMVDPDQVWIGPDVKIAQDVELLPQVMLMGATEIGEDSVIGPNTRLTDTKVGRGCVIEETVAIEAQLDDAATAGPRAYLRPGTHLCEGAKAGTHVEIKKSTIGRGSKVPHLSYIGDTTMGEGVNIGAGSITCNYDGKKKWPTTIGDNVFVGSDTMMVAPVTIGDGAIIGAASCITKEVAPDALALTRPEQKEIPGWAAKKRARQAAEGK